ncbi:hypothetical protein AWB67_06914 [Caballeronia terrestris]|jgi:hypothetical protein|uniref:Uncharacterized protein n=1 Tax=Caballeronia terrestris TaxID=1226301 RepID=A0A158KW57_9BURK|nr:hypothetical protein AWB67_06914 [Caballeronia terrestris]
MLASSAVISVVSEEAVGESEMCRVQTRSVILEEG